MSARAPVLFLFLALGACLPDAPLDAQGPDAGGTGSATDGRRTDAGALPDAGAQPDAGADAGTRADAGTDAGPQADAGLPPPLESTHCPAGDASDVGTNSVVRVQASQPIAHGSVGPEGLRVEVDGRSWPGTLELSPQALTFVPTEPLPAAQRVDAYLSGAVVDTLGRPLAPGGAHWSFVTHSGPVELPGFTYPAPVSPPGAEHATWRELVMDGERALLAWPTGSGVRASAVDGLSFKPFLVIDEGGIHSDQLSFAVAQDSVHFVWTDFYASYGTVLYRRADRGLTAVSSALTGIFPAAYSPRIAAGAPGELAMMWSTSAFHWDEWGAYLLTSPDDGETYGQPRFLELGAATPDLLYTGGRLLMVWTHTGIASAELKLAVSTDGGQSFSAPVTIATTSSQFWEPRLVDAHDGGVLVVWTEGFGIGARGSWARRYSLATGLLEDSVQLTPPAEDHACTYLASAPNGRLAMVHSRGRAFEADWVTHLSLSDDGGRTFGTPDRVAVIGPSSGCPALGYAASGAVYLAWTHGDFKLALTRATPRRPCEATTP